MTTLHIHFSHTRRVSTSQRSLGSRSKTPSKDVQIDLPSRSVSCRSYPSTRRGFQFSITWSHQIGFGTPFTLDGRYTPRVPSPSSSSFCPTSSILAPSLGNFSFQSRDQFRAIQRPSRFLRDSSNSLLFLAASPSARKRLVVCKFP